MEPTILRWIIKEWDDISEWILSFLRDKSVSKPVSDLLWTFNNTVVTYAPNLDEITLQDLIVAYQDGKLTEWQINSIEWFLSYASQFLQIRLWVVSSIDSETSIGVSDLTDTERTLIQESLKWRFWSISITDFSWTFEWIKKKTEREVVDIDLESIDKDSWTPITKGIARFIEKIKSNIFMKKHSPEWGWIEKSEESEEFLESYIWKLLDLETPLDKALLKTIPLDLTLEQQREVISRLIRQIFPQVDKGLNMTFIANSLWVFPNIWGKNGKRTEQSRGFKFWNSISESYLTQILSQSESWTSNDKFMTTALRRIIVPLRFLLLKSKTDNDFIEWNDSAIQVLPQDRIEKTLSNISLEWNGVKSDVSSMTRFFLELSQSERREFLKNITASIVWVSSTKIDLTHIDYIIEKYVWGISEYNRTFVSNLSQLLKDNADSTSLNAEKAREIMYWLSCLRKVKELDTQAEIAYSWDIVPDEELEIYEKAHTAEAEEAERRASTAQKNSDVDTKDIETLNFFTEMCSEFESNEWQYKDDIETLLHDFSQFDNNQVKYVFWILWIRFIDNSEQQVETLKSFLYKKYLENSDLCTKMIHTYKNLMKAKRSLTDEVKQRDLDRVLQWYNQLNSQDQSRFLTDLWVNEEQKDDLSDILHERIFWKKIRKEEQSLSSTVIELREFLLPKKKWLKSGTISKKILTHFKLSIESFSSEELQLFFRETFGNALEWK